MLIPHLFPYQCLLEGFAYHLSCHELCPSVLCACIIIFILSIVLYRRMVLLLCISLYWASNCSVLFGMCISPLSPLTSPVSVRPSPLYIAYPPSHLQCLSDLHPSTLLVPPHISCVCQTFTALHCLSPVSVGPSPLYIACPPSHLQCLSDLNSPLYIACPPSHLLCLFLYIACLSCVCRTFTPLHCCGVGYLPMAMS
jgi:hypothetical protein